MKTALRKLIAISLFLAFTNESGAFGPSPDGSSAETFPIESTGLKCNLKTLKGTYLFAGEILDLKGQPQEQSGMEYYDGKGNITGKLTAKFLPDTVYSNFSYTATYNVNSDCTGKIYNKGVPMADIYVSPDGKYYTETLIIKGAHASGIVSRVTKRLVYGLMPTDKTR